VPVTLRVDGFEPARQKADMLARLLQDLGQLDNQGTLLCSNTQSPFFTESDLSGFRRPSSLKFNKNEKIK
jgi:hypothetical protein